MPPVTWVDSGEDMMKFVRHVKDTRECALDTETTGLNLWKDYVLFWSACPEENTRYCFSPEMLAIYDQELSQDPDISWYFTNMNFDFNMMSNTPAEGLNRNVRIPVGDSYCTLSMDWMRDENREGQHGLKETSRDYLGLHLPPFKEVFGNWLKKETLPERLMRAMREDFDRSISYAASDAWASYRLFHHIKGDLENMHNLDGDDLWSYFNTIEMPFGRVLHNCCRRGIMVDTGYLSDLIPDIEYQMQKIQQKVNRLAGKEVNPNSPKQMREFFIDTLKLKPIKYTKGGTSGERQPSTDEETMNVWAAQGVPAAQLIVQYRGLRKTLGTYVKGLIKHADGNLRIHPTLTQHVAVTGRLSSRDPNLQNIPRPDNDVFHIRSAFVPKEDHVFVVADYEQLEMRLMAHYSGDRNMVDVINKGWDIHCGTASLMFGHKYEDIIAANKKKKAAAQDPSITMTKLEKDMCFSRSAAKNIGFGLNYGKGPKALAEELGVSVDRAKELIETYFTPYPNVRRFIDGTKQFICDEYCVETILGRPRRFHEMETIGPVINKYGRWDKNHVDGRMRGNLSRAERQSVNSVIQGSAADVAKMAMLACEHDEELQNLGVGMLLQIHDELIFEVPEENVKEAMPIIMDNMEHPFPDDLRVPLSVDAGVGYTWDTAKA
jgi:DNA polymerase-1